MNKTVEVAREAIESGAWVLLEYENGKIKLGKKPSKLGDIENYFSLQKRFRGASEEEKQVTREHLISRYEYLEKLAAM